jgi:sigma-B regulation protein RsbU (phosphoserine phosphatase)
VSYETCERAGGDMYAIQPPPAPPVQAEAKAPEWGIVVADASGHGPAAAVMMAVMDSLLSVCPNRIEGPAAILTFLNEHLSLRDIEHSFITALVASWNPESRRLTFASAGHPPALLRRFGGSVERLLGGLSLPLGILPDVGYEEEHADLAAGESLVFYTDGISEARDPRGRPFLISGMEEILPRCGGSARDTRDAILRAVRRHQRRGICEDDRTLLVMKTLPGDN